MSNRHRPLLQRSWKPQKGSVIAGVKAGKCRRPSMASPRAPQAQSPGAATRPLLPPTRPFLGPAPRYLLPWPGETPVWKRVRLHCTDKEPEEEEPRRCAQHDNPAAAAGCPGSGRLRVGAQRRPHPCWPAPDAPLPVVPAPPAEVPPQRGSALPGGGRCWSWAFSAPASVQQPHTHRLVPYPSLPAFLGYPDTPCCC